MQLAIKIIVSGVVLTISSVIFALVAYGPLIRYAIRDQTSLRKKNQIRDIYLKIPFPLDFRIYFFNISNPMEVQNGAKPVLKEIGPYCYDEYEEKVDIIDNEMEDSLTYNSYDIFEFNEEKSRGLSEDDYVTILHPLIVGMAFQVNRDTPALLSFLNQAIVPIFKDPKSIYLTDTVKNILFDGFEINCNVSEFAAKAVCTQLMNSNIPGLKNDPSRDNMLVFSLIGVRNATLGHTMKVSRGIRHSESVGKVLEVDGKKEINKWASKACNRYRGTDGWIIPPLLTPEEGVWTHSVDLCRNVKAKYIRDTVVKGVNVRLYEADLGNMQKNEEDKCYCPTPTTCSRKGVFDLSKCMGAPIVASLPHFLEADEIYRKQVEGMQPIHDKHIIRIYLEVITSAPLIGKKRMQMNFPIAPISKITLMSKLPVALHPIFWLEEGVELEGDFLKIITNKLMLLEVANVSRWLAVFGGLTATGIGIYLYIKNKKSITISSIDSMSNDSEITRSTNELMDQMKTLERTEKGQINPVLSGHEFDRYM